MNIEQKIRNNAASFDDVKMPEGSRERFEVRLNSSFRPKRSGVEKSPANTRKMRFMSWTSLAAAAAVAVFMIVSGLNLDMDKLTDQMPQTADNKLIEMRKMYDQRVDEAIYNLEEVMKNVDDSTRMQINAVIDGLLDMGDVFADMAPMPEEKQMAIAEQVYDNKLRTIELITDRLNK
ncbi:MAG: hypothetical protein J5708_06550 [Bacteroidales bacterium]|nr:hypothetical protein [Bacteroidales bacterium]